MAIGTAAAIGLGLAGAGMAISSSSQGKAASKAAATADRTASMNNALARDIYGQNKDILSPFVGRGGIAGSAINGMLGLPGADTGASWDRFRNFLENSDYSFRAAEGGDQVNSAFAGSGTLQSGAAMKGMERFKQNLQAGYRGEYMNALGNQQGVGLGAGSALAGVGQNHVNTISANNNNAGDAVANAALIRGQNNPLANAMGVIGGGAFQWGLGK